MSFQDLGDLCVRESDAARAEDQYSPARRHCGIGCHLPIAYEPNDRH
jgi:hypothetical protein